MRSRTFHSALARSILAGEASVAAITARMSQTLGQKWRWIRPLARRYLAEFGPAHCPRRKNVIAFLSRDQGLNAAIYRHRRELRIDSWLLESPKMAPCDAATGWNLPVIQTIGDLARWLQLTPGEIEWFADIKRFVSRGGRSGLEPISNYFYSVHRKKDGALRVIEAPKSRLKGVQRKILGELLEQVPVHEAAHAFVRGRSIKTFAQPHSGKAVVARMDLRNFFPSIGRHKVQAFFRVSGYPESVSDLLGGICTNAVPRGLWNNLAYRNDISSMAEARALYAWPHLPQGAPTSPALANICMYRVDMRLHGLALSAGATYTRYADDLAFSGGPEFARGVERFLAHVAAILHEEGFAVHHRKTRIMHKSVRQHLAGLVVNEYPNITRTEFDRLKATLTNCARLGLASQNREAHSAFRSHLEGKVAFVEMVHPEKGARLRRIFDQIPRL